MFYYRIEAASPAYKQRSSFPPHSHRTTDTDSAYCTDSLHFNQNTPEILAGNYKMNYNPPDFEVQVESEVLNGAFGDGEHNLKHSTAKKSGKPVNSSTPKSSKKRWWHAIETVLIVACYFKDLKLWEFF